MQTWNRRQYALLIILTIMALFVMVGYNYINYAESSKQYISKIGSSTLAGATEQLEGYLNKGLNVLATTADSVEFMLNSGADSAEIEEFLTYQSQQYEETIDANFTGIYGVFQGEYLDGSGWTPDADYEPTTREWYKVAMEAGGKPVITSPYVDAMTGNVMISVCKMLSDGYGVISLDVELNYIQQITEEISLEGIGYGVVIDSKGVVIAHREPNERGTSYALADGENKTLLEQMLTVKNGSFEMVMGDENVTVFCDTVSDEWNVAMIISSDALFADSYTFLQGNILLCIAIAVLVIAFFTSTFSKINQTVKLEIESNDKVEEINKNTIRALVRTIDAKDRYTNGHSLRVAEYAKEIAKRMDKSQEEQEQIYLAGLLHDVGKIRIDKEIINKPGKLTDEEYEQIKIHPVASYYILKDIYGNGPVATGAKFHHERYDGKGYPNGLKGNDIPEIARILGVADTYDAMASNRSYRKALPQDIIRAELEKGKGTQFDPDIADIMIKMIEEDREYKMQESDSSEKTILITDDEIMNIKMVKVIMKDEPQYRIIGAGGGKEALDILEKEQVDLILLDVMMPDMDGFETLKEIRAKYDIPVIFMTGDKKLETIERAVSYGVEEYITKPFLPLALKEVVHSMLS